MCVSVFGALLKFMPRDARAIAEAGSWEALQRDLVQKKGV